MVKEINPKETNRAEAFELWMSSPMPINGDTYQNI